MITFRDIENLTNHDDYLGFGYLGHSDRNHDADVHLARAANRSGLSLDDVFLWANSKCGRFFMDMHGRPHPDESMFTDLLAHDIEKHLPALRDEA